MLLLDDLLDHSSELTTCEVRTSTDSLFVEGESIPHWVGLEYMGQASFVHSVLKEFDSESEGKSGVLVSARDVSINVDSFEIDRKYIVEAEEIFYEENLRSSKSRIIDPREDSILMDARLNAYVSENLEEIEFK